MLHEEPKAANHWRWIAWLRRRRCTECGLRWPCPDEKVRRVKHRAALAANQRAIGRASVTAARPMESGRAGNLTPAQVWRANGRHSASS